MRYINLKLEEKQNLENHYKTHPKHYFRQRCYALLLSNGGMSVPQIAELLEVRTRTIYVWMNRWQKNGIAGLSIRVGSGRKPFLSLSNTAIVEVVKKKPKSTLAALNKCAEN